MDSQAVRVGSWSRLSAWLAACGRLIARQSSVWLGAAMIALVWGSIGFYLKIEHDAAEQSAIRHSHNLTHVLESHLSRSLHDIDRSLKIVRRSYMLYPEGFDFRDWMHGSLLADDQVLQLSIIGADGFLKRSSFGNAPSTPVDLSDREHFRTFAFGAGDDMLISKPVVGRVSGRMSIQFARRIGNPDGSFGGVIVASVDPAYFSRLYGSVDVGPSGRIRVIGTDGITRSVGSRSPEPPALDMSRSTLFERYQNARSDWFYSRSGSNDDTWRLITYRVLDDFPLIVTVGLAAEELFAPIESKRRWYEAVALALTALILVIVGFAVRSRLALERAYEKIREQKLQRDAALEHMSQGLSMFDGRGRLVVCNNQFMQLYGLADGDVQPGRALEHILRACKERGSFPEDIDRYVADLKTRLRDRASFTLVSQLGGGRTVVVVNCPLPDGGWVATHEDVTRRTRAELELDSTKRFLDTVVENVPLAIMVKDPVRLCYTLVNRAAERLLGVPRAEILGRRAEDFWQPEQAAAISARDNELLIHTDRDLFVAKNPVRTPDGVDRIVTTRRFMVRDKNHDPQHLLAVIEDVTERESSEARIVYMANHDPLTGLANRTLFGQSLETALAGLRRDMRLAALFVDLDHFKEINDTQGHLVGDGVLKAVAERLRACVGAGDVVARLGGDEFAIIVTGVERSLDVAALAERIQAALEEPFDIDDHRASVGVSIGIAMAPGDADEATELLKRADIALYRAKADGRNTYRFFEPEMDRRLKARRGLEADLRAALAAGAFEVFYQPILNARSNAIVGMEALLRWRHAERGMVSPAEFIPVAEETGLIVPLGEWTIRQVCADATRWPAGIKVAINLSPNQFASKTLVQTFVNALAVSGLAADRIELEITERILMRDDPESLATLEQLRALGMSVVMDDFGTGYSSLSYLHRFSFNKIKIDRSFVSGLADGNDVSLAIIETVASLAETIKVPTVAEGIETEAQLELIRSLGCTEYQGYLFSPPRPVAEIDALFFGSAATAA